MYACNTVGSTSSVYIIICLSYFILHTFSLSLSLSLSLSHSISLSSMLSHIHACKHNTNTKNECTHTHTHTHFPPTPPPPPHTHRVLESQVAELSSSRAELLSELEKCKSEMKISQESHTSQLQALERENDVLREQLKKYVGMVQAHRRESTAKTTESAITSSGSGTAGM